MRELEFKSLLRTIQNTLKAANMVKQMTERSMRGVSVTKTQLNVLGFSQTWTHEWDESVYFYILSSSVFQCNTGTAAYTDADALNHFLYAGQQSSDDLCLMQDGLSAPTVLSFKTLPVDKKDALLRNLWKAEEGVLKPHHRFVHVGVGTEKYMDLSLCVCVHLYRCMHDHLFTDT